MLGFVLGALTAGLAIWYWGDQIREFAKKQYERRP
jgi:hypothetical protein